MEDGTKQHSFDKSGTPLNNTILIEKEDFASESTDWLKQMVISYVIQCCYYNILDEGISYSPVVTMARNVSMRNLFQ